MNKIKLFAAPSITTLQSEINKWLSDHKDAHIVETNLSSLTTASMSKTEKEYAFYILYIPGEQAEEESVMQASMHMPAELTDSKIIEMESN
ncbi:hypothetical protein [Pedobacter sp. JCM 36344]|uniref:hypothetical protein n=1 Tax=Pedobacter sp. JCM 36344 TaxID=3374280 RepID=UPI00397D3584